MGQKFTSLRQNTLNKIDFLGLISKQWPESLKSELEYRRT